MIFFSINVNCKIWRKWSATFKRTLSVIINMYINQLHQPITVCKRIKMKLCVFYLQNIIPTTMTPMTPIMIIIWKKKTMIFTIMVHLCWKLHNFLFSLKHLFRCAQQLINRGECGEIPAWGAFRNTGTVPVFLNAPQAENTVQTCSSKKLRIGFRLKLCPLQYIHESSPSTTVRTNRHMNTPWVYFGDESV